jgi:transposase
MAAAKDSRRTKRVTGDVRAPSGVRCITIMNFNQTWFMQQYHKRSNVESTFSMIKAKFGDSLRSKTRTAQINEALCKVLAHNLCCLIQSIYELGIEPTFWADESQTCN